MKTNTLFAIAMVSLLLVGCDEKQHSVSYYKEHKEERAKKIAECQENVGGKRMTPNCQNAQKAAFSLELNKNGRSPFRDMDTSKMPKMGE